MILLFVHGWAFDAGVWSKLAALLPQAEHRFVDRGYFAKAAEPEPTGPTIAVTHSFGTMQVLRDPPPDCRGLVAINGFDCFTARAGVPGVPARMVDRMIARFDAAPEAVVAEFRRRCGADAPDAGLHAVPLRDDLSALRDLDCREDSARAAFPILSLQGGADPILPPAMRDSVFSAAKFPVGRSTLPAAGHLLPLTDAPRCARAVAAFLEQAA